MDAGRLLVKLPETLPMSFPLKTVLALGALIILAIPPAVFLWVALGYGLGIEGSFSALVAQYAAPRQNLLVCGAMGLAPWLLLLLVLGIVWRVAPKSTVRPALAVGGLVPLFAVLVWVNFDYWPHFLPSRTYPGFPHGLEFVIGPIFFAPVAMTFGMLSAWLIARSRG